MPVPGLVPNIRITDPSAPEASPLEDLIVENAEEADSPNIDEDGNLVSIEHEDGSVTVSLNGPIESAINDGNPDGWFDNLVDRIDDFELARIADELLRGIDDDIQSRKEWIEDRAQGIRLLGLKIEIPGVSSTGDGAPVEGMSRIRHPLLLEATLRFQANARSELLPTDGPVKVRDDANGSTVERDRLADALENDFNHYLTATATEYYPDTDRMLFMLGFGGSSFKKVYFCPIRNRPVSESVDADDLIVNNGATDLSNAKRVTHRISMTPSTLRRMQILGVYRDVDLMTPSVPNFDSVKREEASQQGLSLGSNNPDDRDREIYECYCELDVSGFEHRHKGKPSGLTVPYRVTLDVASREILSIVRDYDEETKDLPEKRQTFVKYTFIPGMGFYDIGLLHILGNTTNAVTAAWREMLDAGMFANFPGFLMADTGARQNTNIFRIPPGGGALVKTGGMKLSDAVMPMPYKEPGAALMTLASNIAETGQRIGGIAEMAVGEGRNDAPVGTTIAMIEQAQKVLSSVHKRLHTSQAQEFQLLLRCFRENPTSFWQRAKRPAYPWDEQTFLTALNDVELVPQADPNTSSQTQRIMKVMALKQMQAQNPSLYDPIAIDLAALKAIGWSNPEQFLVPPEAMGAPPPELMERQAKAQNDAKRADASMMDAQTRAEQAKIKAQIDMQKAQLEMQRAEQAMKIASENAVQKKLDREARERIELINVAERLAVHPYSAGLVQPLIKPTIDKIAAQELGLGAGTGEVQ
jgi:hypothetical protein